MKKIAFVTTFCPHHRTKTFELLSQFHQITFYFFSAGDEWYWQQEHGVEKGKFDYEYIKGFRIGKTRFTPGLPFKLWKGNYDVYIKCINGKFALPITFLIAKLRKKPFILWTGIWMRLQTKAHRLIFPLTRFIYHHSNAIVVYGEHVKSYLESEGISPERIFVAAHAVDNAFFNREIPSEKKEKLLGDLNIDKTAKIILYLGRLEQIKGLKYLITAFSKIKSENAFLVFAGTGSQEEELKKVVEELRISSKVRFVGYVPQEKASIYYSLSWVLVLPSVTMPYGKETWGLVVNEAFNQGIPVIATEAVGAAAGGLVQDNVNGFIVNERDSEALMKSLGSILEDSELRRKFSRNAKEIIATWNNENMVRGFQAAIDYVSKNSSSKETS